jgi:hypothetical protein
MEKVHAWSRRPWYERAWLTWPLGWQVASLLLWIGGIVLGVWLLPVAQQILAAAASSLTTAVATGTAAFDGRVVPAITATRLVWRAVVEPAVPYAFAIVALMGLACTLLGAALNHVVLGRMIQR